LIDIQSPADLTALRPLFAGQPTVFFLDAMIAGNCAFRAWSGGAGQPGSALLWDERDLIFLIGKADDPDFNADLAFLLSEIILPQADSHGRDAFLFHTSSEDWDAVVTPLLPGFTFNRYPRVIYEEVAAPPSGWRKSVPPGLLIRPIDRKLLAETSLEGMESLIEEIECCWPSKKRFLEMGFGAAVLDGRKIVSRITAEYASPGTIGIGIATEEPYRGRGLAAAATFAFLEMCAERRLAPHWDAWKNNVPSVRAAEKAGFIHPIDYSALLAYRG
jgi:RimJ/RimL family protein N-acetyltransferase